LKVTYDNLLQSFGFNVNLRPYGKGMMGALMGKAGIATIEAGGVLRTCTPPTLTQQTDSARLYEHSPSS